MPREGVMAYDSNGEFNHLHLVTVTLATFNCGNSCRKLGQPYDGKAVVWAGGLKFCETCACMPHNQVSRAQAPEHWREHINVSPIQIAAE